MIHLDVKEIVFTIEIINLDVKISSKKIILSLIFEIDSNNIHIKMALIDQDTMVLLQAIIL